MQFGVWVLVLLASLAILYVVYEILYGVLFKLPNRVIRHLNLRRAGWPPLHLDADGESTEWMKSKPPCPICGANKEEDEACDTDKHVAHEQRTRLSFCTIEETNRDAFEKKVNVYLESGWTPHGPMLLHENKFVQALIHVRTQC